MQHARGRGESGPAAELLGALAGAVQAPSRASTSCSERALTPRQPERDGSGTKAKGGE